MSSNSIIDGFVAKKKANSEFVSLSNGESVEVKLREIKIITKAGFGGTGEKEVLRLVCDVMTSDGLKTKKFDNGSQSFAQELSEKGVQIGWTFTITRNGEKEKTRYTISGVKDNTGTPSVPPPPIENTIVPGTKNDLPEGLR